MLKTTLLLLACDAALGFAGTYPALRASAAHTILRRAEAPIASLPPLALHVAARPESLLSATVRCVTSVTRAQAALLLISVILVRALLKNYIRQDKSEPEGATAVVDRNLTMREAFNELGVALGGASIAAAEAAADELGRVAPIARLQREEAEARGTARVARLVAGRRRVV